MAGEVFAVAGSDLTAAPTAAAISAVPVAPQPTGGQGLALDPTGNLPLAVRQKLPGYLYGYQEYISNVSVTATSEATANTVVTAPAVTLDGTTLICVRFFAFEAGTAAANVQLNFWLYDQVGTAAAASIGEIAALLNTTGVDGSQILAERYLTPAAGTHTYSIRASNGSAGTATVFAGPGGLGNDVPGFIRVTRA